MGPSQAQACSPRGQATMAPAAFVPCAHLPPDLPGGALAHWSHLSTCCPHPEVARMLGGGPNADFAAPRLWA